MQRREQHGGRINLAVAGLFWFHSLVWLISRKLFDEREQACDEKVLETYSTPETYAAGILKVVRFSFGWKVAAVTGAGSGSNLRRRIDNIMETGKEKRRVSVAAKIVTTGLLGVTLVAIVFAGTHPTSSVNAGKEGPDAVTISILSPASRWAGRKMRRIKRDSTTAPSAAGVNPTQPATPANPPQPPQPTAVPVLENSAGPQNTAAPAQP